MKKLFVLVLVCFAVCSYAQQVTNLIAPPQQYQGVWKLLGMSSDKGVTVKEGSYQDFCKMTATKVHNYDGTVYSISKVGVIEEKGVEYVSILFRELPNIMWVLSDAGGHRVLVQTFSIEPYQETFRALFLVMD